MKKLLRTLIVISIITFCVYMVLQKRNAVVNPITTGQVTTRIDLSGCISYFDGCNHCSVKDGKPDACTLMYCEKPTAPKCLQYATGSETTREVTITKDQGYITQVYSERGKNYLKIDYVDYEDCLSDMSNCPSGSAPVINNNALIRTFEIAPTATFYIIKDVLTNPNDRATAYTQYDGPSLWEEFKYWANNDILTLQQNCDGIDLTTCPINYYGAGKTSIVEIEHDTQRIYKVTEIFRP